MKTHITYCDNRTQTTIYQLDDIDIIPNKGEFVYIEQIPYEVTQRIFLVEDKKVIVNIYVAPCQSKITNNQKNYTNEHHRI